MSAVGFIPLEPEDPELEKLREACKRVSFTIKSITDAQKATSKLNVGQAQDRLTNALWQAREAKKTLAEIGKSKTAAKPKQAAKMSAFVETR